MKISASKKTITILAVCSVLLFLAGISLLYKDVITNGLKYGRWFTLDRYEELLEDCSYKREGKELLMTCNALILPASEFDQNVTEHCFNFFTIPKENEKSIYTFNICESNENIKYEGLEEWLSEEKMTPVKFTIMYKSTNYMYFTYSSLKIENATEEELYEEFYKNSHLKSLNYSIASEYAFPDAYNNYVYVEDSTFVENDGIGHISIFSAFLLEKEMMGGEMVYRFKTKIENKDIEFQTYSNSFILHNGDYFENVTYENIDAMEVGKEYALSLLYLDNKSDVISEEINSWCEREEIHLSRQSLCGNKEKILGTNLNVTDKDSIIEELSSGQETVDLLDTIIFQVTVI